MNKKPLAIILAFFIVFTPVYSYAVLPALAAAVASSGGRVLVGNVIKRVGQAALSRTGMASMAAGLVYMASTKSAIEQDGWTIDYGSGGGGAGGSWDSPGKGVDSQGNIDIAIYKMPPNENCELQIGFGSKYLSQSAHNAERLAYLTIQNSASTPHNVLSHADNPSVYSAEIARLKQSYASYDLPEWRLIGNISLPYVLIEQTQTGSTVANSKFMSGDSTHIRCVPYPTNKKIYITDNEFNAYLTKNITNNQAGDIIKNIYNYDYSQHPNVTINNNTTGGSDINNDLSISADPELNVTPRLRLDLETNKVNLDNVNDTNCTKNDSGEYDNCTGEPDPEEETDPDPEDPNNPQPPKPPPIECTANGFYQKICNWMDWTQQPHNPDLDTTIQVTDKTSDIVIDSSRISFDNQCPTPKPIDISVVGYSFSEYLDYQPICDFFIKLKPFVVGIGGVSSALIIAGGARRG